MAGVIVLDANVLIALLDASDAHHAWAVRFLLDHTDAEFSMSALTWAECLVYPTRNGTLARVFEQVTDLQFDIEELTDTDAVQLAAIRAESGLRMPDAVVLQTALKRSAAVATTDVTLARAAASAGHTVFTAE